MPKAKYNAIKISFFDDKFKNAMRDYYTYGFKSSEELNQADTTLYNNWKLITTILRDNWKYDKSGKESNYYIMFKGSEKNMNNPLNIFYRYHHLGKIGNYTNILLELNQLTNLRNGMASTGLSDVEFGYEHDKVGEDLKYKIIYNWEEMIAKNSTIDDIKTTPIRATYQFNPLINFDSGFLINKNIKNNLYQLGDLGFIYNIAQDNTTLLNEWIIGQLKLYDKIQNNENKNVEFTDRNEIKKQWNESYWQLSPLTIGKIIDDVFTENGTLNKNLLVKLNDLLTFYSQYMVLGEIGTTIKERIQFQDGKINQEIFKFKHNYIMESLFDYNLLDLLIAIENHYFCCIHYCHGTQNQNEDYFIVPLELRISVTNGREHIMCYDILTDRLTSLRIEFIDKMELYEASIKNLICNGKKVIIDHNLINIKVKCARRMLDYVWGVDTSNCRVNNDFDKKLKTIKMSIDYNLKDENYIHQRLKREKRNGIINEENKKISQINYKLLSKKEMRPWIRSYYTRVESIKGLNDIYFNIEEDIENMCYVYFKSLDYEKHEKKDLFFSYNTISVEAKPISVLKGHGALFNELYSVYSQIMIESIIEFSRFNIDENKNDWLKKVLIKSLKKDDIKQIKNYFKKQYDYNIEKKEILNNKKNLLLIRQKINKEIKELNKDNHVLDMKENEREVINQEIIDLNNKLKMINSKKRINHIEIIKIIKKALFSIKRSYFQKDVQIDMNELAESQIYEIVEIITRKLYFYFKNLKKENSFENDLDKYFEIDFINSLSILLINTNTLEKILRKNIKKYCHVLDDWERNDIESEIIKIMIKSKLIDIKGYTKYVFDKNVRSYFMDILPLSLIELRWLKTVLQDDLADIFLDKDIIDKIIKIIDQNSIYPIYEFKLEQNIKYYDRYINEEYFEKEHIKKLIANLHSLYPKYMHIKYVNYKEQEKEGIYKPLWIEYSKRNNRFQVICFDSRNDNYTYINLERIKSIKESSYIMKTDSYSLKEERSKEKIEVKKDYRKIKVLFFNNRNLPDRILTEFSPWKKTCIFNGKSKQFEMELTYDRHEEKEILIRLLGYGPYIKITSDEGDNYILREFKNRILQQYKRLFKKEYMVEEEKLNIER